MDSVDAPPADVTDDPAPDAASAAPALLASVFDIDDRD